MADSLCRQLVVAATRLGHRGNPSAWAAAAAVLASTIDSGAGRSVDTWVFALRLRVGVPPPGDRALCPILYTL